MSSDLLTEFGTAPDGTPVMRAALRNGPAHAGIIGWGASLQDMRLDGVAHALVLGSAAFAPYLSTMRYFGAIVGRVANRIKGGMTPLDGAMLSLDRNEGNTTTLHGGATGSGERNWTFTEVTDSACTLSLRMADGESGFPGNLDVTASYALDDHGALSLTITAVTDQPTLCNFAHHAFWSLSPKGLADQTLEVAADSYLPVDVQKIPLGAPQPVAGTRFDYRKAAAIIDPDGVELDHNFCLRGSDRMHPVCTLRGPGLALDITSTEPGLQVYDASRMDTTPHTGHGGRPYGRHAGVALEPQRWPDAPNQTGYPDITLRPGETYRQETVFHLRKN